MLCWKEKNNPFESKFGIPPSFLMANPRTCYSVFLDMTSWNLTNHWASSEEALSSSFTWGVAGTFCCFWPLSIKNWQYSIGFGGPEQGLAGGAGSRETKTLATSCMLGLSDGLRFVQRRASWKAFFTWVKFMHVTDTSGSTASITVLLSAFDKIWGKINKLRKGARSKKLKLRTMISTKYW